MAGESGDAGAMREVWAKAVDQVKRSVIAPTLWRALENTVAVAWEDSNFVVGIGTAEGGHAGQLNSGEHRSTIERVLRTLTGNPELRFRVIGGTAYEDWQYEKARDAAAVSQQQEASVRRVQAAEGYANWDEVHDQISRLWAGSEYRSLASGKARYMDQAVARLVQAMSGLMPADGKTNDQTERGLSRVIERIASTIGADSSLIGYLVLERWRRESAK